MKQLNGINPIDIYFYPMGLFKEGQFMFTAGSSDSKLLS